MQATMMAQMASAASFLILLFLPLKSCLPSEWPRPTVPHFLPIRGQSWEQWLSRSEWEDKRSAPPVGLDEGLFQDQRPSQSCKPSGSTLILQRERGERSASSSKRRDGRPNSLDLTFHLLREFLEMSREERLAQKARSNKILLHNIGK
ncbi:corticoliberin-like [Hemicordylus capensis]|uniref:corticoliberin-like n=1 Tax=Hemicordylus capensis TaxID=884348 RepID=UPI0023024673|nr:corticoliberin-like [Hemicordylus capensis]